MPQIKITYFDFHGGRAEPARIALHMGGIEFDDHRISFEEFTAQRDSYPCRCVPVADIDGHQVAQSNAINRYVGKLTGLYPDDPVQAMFCDEAMEANEDILFHVVKTFGLEGEALKTARQELTAGWLTTYLKGIERMLQRGGDYFADGRLTVADLKIFVWVRSLTAGTLDHVPADLVSDIAPALVAHQDRV
ncbi:MAG: glutathione S-transferase family protein, partial [Pseudomonadota bacterium]